MKRRGITVAAALCIGLIVGMAIAPAGAHVTNRFSHLWSQHIKPTLEREGYTPVVESIVANSGPAATSLGDQETLVANLSVNGTNPLEVPFPARVIVHGSVVLVNRDEPEHRYVECWLNLYPPAGNRISPPSIVSMASIAATIPLVGSVAVDPGTYDVSITCTGESGTAWFKAAASVMAVRR